MTADPAKLRAALDELQAAVAARTPKPLKGCAPVRQGSDEYRCLTCNRVWDSHEDKPNCERD